MKKFLVLALASLTTLQASADIDLKVIYDSTKPLSYVVDVKPTEDGKGYTVIQNTDRIGTTVSEVTYCLNDTDKIVDCTLDSYKTRKNYCIETVSEITSKTEISASGFFFLKPTIGAKTREVDCDIYKSTTKTK